MVEYYNDTLELDSYLHLVQHFIIMKQFWEAYWFAIYKKDVPELNKFVHHVRDTKLLLNYPQPKDMEHFLINFDDNFTRNLFNNEKLPYTCSIFYDIP